MKTANLGFPRIGYNRELKRAVEAYWAGKLDEHGLQQCCRRLREANWRLQSDLGIDVIPSNDFSLYDQMLDATAMVGAVPPRFDWQGGTVDLDLYFALARGVSGRASRGDVPALEMTKWCDTNYHYLVPELAADQTFYLATHKPIDEFVEAQRLGITTRPVLIGPVSYLWLAKCAGRPFDRLRLLEGLLPVYEQLLERLRAVGATWVQMDEPILVLDLPDDTRDALIRCYQRLHEAIPGVSLMLTTYFGSLGENLKTACRLPVAGLHVDVVNGREQLNAVLANLAEDKILSLGVIDGRNVWRADLDDALQLLWTAAERIGMDRCVIAPSCSLLHCPIDLDLETALDERIRSWLAFAKQKLQEVRLLGRAIEDGVVNWAAELEANRRALRDRQDSPLVHVPEVRIRVQEVTDQMLTRQSPFWNRRTVQRRQLNLPLLPTTTIGSFPQTPAVRSARADFKAGRCSAAEYEARMREQIELAIRFQEETGLDVLVHGEPERNDMVEYFGGQLTGFAFTRHGWVQSYGSRCVKPPIIYGDVSRPRPMTVPWICHAQSLTRKPVKGMLTGPVTILQWSFVRNDQPRSDTCRQIALALRDEVADLEAAGIRVIQIDEPALREGLPLRRAAWQGYLDWAVACFRLASSGVRDETQIHTHMCYAEFNDIIEAIAALDADVISLEAARSRLELLSAFEQFDYPNEIGPGVYDIHSPRVPSREEIATLLRSALRRFPADCLWVNPDCGLKTRDWPEVRAALANMVDAAQELRRELATAHHA
jgi:5-methyltetrahydropteroyltriglutamate--homocysteine methyltransferase